MDARSLEESIRKDIENAANDQALEEARIKYLGRRGLVTSLLKNIKDAPPAERPKLGATSNRLKKLAESLIEEKLTVLRAAQPASRFYTPPHDATLPAHDGLTGHRHVLSKVFGEIKDIFVGMGYTLASGPQVELEYYNFQALNFPDEHPSRDEQDTFYITDDMLLRTHTSPVQVRYMEEHKPPLKIIAAGRVFRNESIDPSHAAEFHQVEGLYVDTDVALADLKKDVEIFIQQLFGSKTQVRFRPSFFPFTEPSAEVDMTCFVCRGSGCSVCGKTGWIEIMGSGMVHPNVFRAVGYDPDIYSGFAFGMGVDRVAMIKYGIDDIRLFLGNDLRFLSQF
ncbi:MAG: phenylalanine--tRNA ligase subunit alpha [Candidatus Latescibacterota bacterium]|nr:MAG: phenylalanine--tRNA ligase subunit alpha [Candidatus Latescibacterota bacterium]